MILLAAKFFAMLKHWASLIQLGFFEANNGRTADRRMSGIFRARMVGFRYVLLAIGPAPIIIIPDMAGLHGSAIWLAVVLAISTWAFAILSALTFAAAVSIYRAARVRRAMDRGQKARYPRKRNVR